MKEPSGLLKGILFFSLNRFLQFMAKTIVLKTKTTNVKTQAGLLQRKKIFVNSEILALSGKIEVTKN